jgi:hypothetical protein
MEGKGKASQIKGNVGTRQHKKNEKRSDPDQF